MFPYFDYPHYALLTQHFICYKYKSFCISFILKTKQTDTKLCPIVDCLARKLERKNYSKSLGCVENKDVETRNTTVFCPEKLSDSSKLTPFFSV